MNGCISIQDKWVNVGLVTAAGVVAGSAGLLFYLNREKNSEKKDSTSTEVNNRSCSECFSLNESSVSEEWGEHPVLSKRASYKNPARGKTKIPGSIPIPAPKPSPRRRHRHDRGYDEDHQVPHEESSTDDVFHKAFNNSSTGAVRKDKKKHIPLPPTRSNIKQMDSATAKIILNAVASVEEPSKATMNNFNKWLGRSSSKKVTYNDEDVGLNVFSKWRRELEAVNEIYEDDTPHIINRYSYSFQQKLSAYRKQKQGEKYKVRTAPSKNLSATEQGKCSSRTEKEKWPTCVEATKSSSDVEGSKSVNIDVSNNLNKTEGAESVKIDGSKCLSNMEGSTPVNVDGSTCLSKTDGKSIKIDGSKCFKMEGAKPVKIDESTCLSKTEDAKSVKIDGSTCLSKMEGIKPENEAEAKCLTGIGGDYCRMPYTVDTNPRRILRTHKKTRIERLKK